MNDLAEQPSQIIERRNKSRSSASQEALYFKVPGLSLCLPLDNVTKVLPIMALQELPHTPDYLVGLMNLNGASLPVIDLSLRLEREPPVYTLDTPILLCSDGDFYCGLIVEDVQGVDRIRNSHRQMSNMLEEGNLPFLAVFDNDKNLTFMLDVTKLLDISLDQLSVADSKLTIKNSGEQNVVKP
ncbi:MAG: chemotaxis protein CheW [Kangiellaceae bacterium]|jgi:purine-binding chemotaxis protein CheW